VTLAKTLHCEEKSLIYGGMAGTKYQELGGMRKEGLSSEDVPKCANFKPWSGKRQRISKVHKKGDSQSNVA
jgi:hypothetical protein